MPRGQLAQAAQEGGRCGDVATLTLHWLDDERGRPGRLDLLGEEPLEMLEADGTGPLLIAVEIAIGVRERRDVHARHHGS